MLKFICSLALAITFVYYGSTQPDATSLGMFCTRNEDCLGGGLICRIPNSNCSFGECGCDVGFTFDYLDSKCKRTVRLSSRCSTATQACKELNSECKNGYCVCSQGFVKRRAIDGIAWMCSPRRANGTYGRRCFSNDDCLLPFVCDQTSRKCDCPLWMSYTYNNKRACAPKSVRDGCATNEDCLSINADCVNGICRCPGGFKEITTYRQFVDSVTSSYARWKIVACIGREEPVVNGTSSCLNTLSRSRSVTCNADSFCSPCNPNHNMTGFCQAITTIPKFRRSVSDIWN